ncbi:hypothetical protein L7F22_062044 [Adiantum nelumboides]|nr:hypothetical protein [Adiantum nelumboides]
MGRDCRAEARVSNMQVSLAKRAPLLSRGLVDMNHMDAQQGNRPAGPAGSRLHVSDDVLFCVGQSRKPYHVSAESLIRNSAFFRNLLSKTRGAAPPVMMDCEESVFECLLLLMRYGAWEALPPLSKAQAFQLKKEAELYGVHYIEPPPLPPKSPSDVDSLASSPPSEQPDSARPRRRLIPPRLSDGVRLFGATSRQLSELPTFPLHLADPAKLVLAVCMDEDKVSIYSCHHCCSTSKTQWALSFHYRHAFCTACGRPPTNLPPKLFAEMFTGAAAQYTARDQAVNGVKPAANWSVGSDSTCLLRLVSSPACGPDACSSATCVAASRLNADTVWAATFFYSHAFCTRCGQAAPGSALLSVLFALRYGGASAKGSSKRSSFKIPTPTSPDA